MDDNCSFVWNAAESLTLTLPTGSVLRLEVTNRVPRWPMRALTRGENAACPIAEGGASGSGGPAPAEAESEEQQEQDELLLEGDLPPDHYLTHRPKMARCEACQEAKMYHRQHRRSSGESRAVVRRRDLYGPH